MGLFLSIPPRPASQIFFAEKSASSILGYIAGNKSQTNKHRQTEWSLTSCVSFAVLAKNHMSKLSRKEFPLTLFLYLNMTWRKDGRLPQCWEFARPFAAPMGTIFPSLPKSTSPSDPTGAMAGSAPAGWLWLFSPLDPRGNSNPWVGARGSGLVSGVAL